MSYPYRPFYKLTIAGWKRTDLLTCKRGDIIKPHNNSGRFVVHFKIDKITMRCKQITKGVQI